MVPTAALMCYSVLAALSQFIQRNNVIRWLASGINFTTTTTTTSSQTTPATVATNTHCALAPSRAIVAALRHSSPLHCCRPFPAAVAGDATRCTRALLSHGVKAWRPYGLETLSSMIT